LKKIISEGAYSRRNIPLKNDKENTTQASTNFFQTQKRLPSLKYLGGISVN